MMSSRSYARHLDSILTVDSLDMAEEQQDEEQDATPGLMAISLTALSQQFKEIMKQVEEQGGDGKPIQMAKIFLDPSSKLSLRQMEEQEKEQEDTSKPSDLAKILLGSISPLLQIKQDQKGETGERSGFILPEIQTRKFEKHSVIHLSKRKAEVQDGLQLDGERRIVKNE